MSIVDGDLTLLESIPCYKMHGLGNDYIYCLEHQLPGEIDIPSLAIDVSARHTGIGADGLVIIGPGRDGADLDMRIFNADGSQAQMCGNASRCVALLGRLLHLTDKDDIALSTLSGTKLLHLHDYDGSPQCSVTVDMGTPILESSLIPVRAESLSGYPPAIAVDYHGTPLRFVPVSMGNPHGVCFIDTDPDDALVLGFGPEMERHPAWPEKANIEIAHVLDRHNIRMRVWERGSGETMACGTGACATAVAAILCGLTDREVHIHLPGGTLSIVWREADSHVLMSGPATLVAKIKYITTHDKYTP